MKINKKIFPIIGIIILFSAIYMLVAVRPVRNAIQFEPQWTIDVATSAINPVYSSLMPFKLGNRIGYYTADGTVATVRNIEQKGIISSQYLSTFSYDAKEIIFSTASGETSATIQKAGFPFFEEERIFMFSPNGNAFSFHSPNGAEQWSYENYVPVTAFASNNKNVVAGFADGNVIVFDLWGNKVQEFYPGGSEYEVIFGVNVSKSGRYVACLSGLDMQRIVVTDIEGNTSKIIFHKYIENASLEQRLVYFSENEKYVFINAKDTLSVVNIEENTEKTIPIKGKVVTIKEVHYGDYYFVLSKYRGESTVSIFNKDMFAVGSFSFDEENTFIDTDNENIYIGNGATISKIYINDNK